MSFKDSVNRVASAYVKWQHRQAVTLPSQENGGKPSYDEDFKAGYVAGKAAYAKNDQVSKADAQKAYRRVSKKHGSWWVDGYTAAIDIARGASNTTPAQIARKMKLAKTAADPDIFAYDRASDIEFFFNPFFGIAQVGMGGEWWVGNVRPGQNVLHHKKERVDPAYKPVTVRVEKVGHKMRFAVMGGFGGGASFILGFKGM